jgi:hypothetical protein
MSNLDRDTQQELTAAVSARYRRSTKVEKALILDEFIAITGYHRKHAIRVLNSGTPQRQEGRRGRASVYDEAVQQALIVLWEASDRICGKRLKPLIPLLISALERHGHLELDAIVREKLLQASASTIDRLLAPARSAGRPHDKKRSVPAIRAAVPVRTFGDWENPDPGFMEADLVAHCGGNMGGSFVHTLVLTDVATGWTECVPLLVRDSGLVVAALRRLSETMPFPFRGIDTDNGGEFVNETLQAYCLSEGLEFTRSRPYRKNDQAWVEQKNGAVVRRLVGYGRLEGIAAAETLSRLYASSRLFVNFFQPFFKLIEKQRFGARVSKRYETPATPCSRLLASKTINEAIKHRLRAVTLTLDPLRLLDEIRHVQRHVAGLAQGRELAMLTHRDADLERFLASLSTLWRSGEVRPTHQKAPKRKHDWRTRPDAFVDVWPQVLVWLETEPDRTAKELFLRLQALHPRRFSDGQLRTLQRRVKEWRSLAAKKLILAHNSSSLNGVSHTKTVGNILSETPGNKVT